MDARILFRDEKELREFVMSVISLVTRNSRPLPVVYDSRGNRAILPLDPSMQ